METKQALSSPFHQKKVLGFSSLFCGMKLNTMQNFWQKDIHSLFWILASRGKKSQKTKKPSPIP
jgi:hypothetical protein